MSAVSPWGLLVIAWLAQPVLADQPPSPPLFDRQPALAQQWPSPASNSGVSPANEFVPRSAYYPQTPNASGSSSFRPSPTGQLPAGQTWSPDNANPYSQNNLSRNAQPQRFPPVDAIPTDDRSPRMANLVPQTGPGSDRITPQVPANRSGTTSFGVEPRAETPRGTNSVPMNASQSRFPQNQLPQRSYQPAPESAPPAEVFEPSQIIAWVGDQPIQVGDVMPMVDQALAPKLAEIPAEELEAQKEQINAVRNKWMEQALDGFIETKLLYMDFLRSIPADKKDQALPEMKRRAGDQFYEKQLPAAMEKAQVASLAEFDRKLREYGSSLEKQKIAFIEKAFGQSRLSQEIDYEPEVTHQEMLDYYYEHAADYEQPAKVRWEKLTVKFDQFPNKAEAWRALANMGNEVLRGAPLSAVAKRRSQGVDAVDGGYHDWTTRGSLASQVLDNAIFSLPPGRLSAPLEDEKGFHIVRVMQREESTRTPFTEAQVDIKELLRKQKIRQQIDDYVANLKKEIPVWTVFDAKQAAGASVEGETLP